MNILLSIFVTSAIAGHMVFELGAQVVRKVRSKL